jgi:hypothetical protein
MNSYTLLSKRLNLLKNFVITTKKTFQIARILKLNLVINNNYDNQNEIKTSFNDKFFEIAIFDRNNNKSLAKRLPFIWLRDSCKCNQCFDHKNEEQSYNLTNSSIDIHPVAITHQSDNTFCVKCIEFLFTCKCLLEFLFINLKGLMDMIQLII